MTKTTGAFMELVSHGKDSGGHNQEVRLQTAASMVNESAMG